MTEGSEGEEGAGSMRKRRTTLEDGRYLIYYTFEEEVWEGNSPTGPGPEPEAEAAEERNV